MKCINTDCLPQTSEGATVKTEENETTDILHLTFFLTEDLVQKYQEINLISYN